MGDRKFLRRLRPRLVSGVILLSGGVDSVTTLYYAKKCGYKLTALIFDYHQKHKKEIECARRIARLNKINYIIEKVDLSWSKSALTDREVKIPLNRNGKEKEVPSTYVAARNIIFLSYAVSLAESIGVKEIFIGAHTQDYSGYPDCRSQFLKSFQDAVNLGTKDKGIKIIAPLINKGKKEIIELATRLGVPFQYTWSCYKGGLHPCLKCDSCRFRVKAFRELGLKDPLNDEGKDSGDF